ncbi:MAG: nitroreductase family deazaflavin-dependent oxidoreductase [Gammaproteobacteria bacterium]|jgi:F420H(2)-dependent quinone reductase|nr:nitroreductase family deazaflavin-dependent oxidoreductase [Gammaproteobacteria bacterium]MBT4491667.1 nitroreductase family deazaflavin-dependent oxidoreductase [Gammaproteobacteria bacterium]MBT7369555.1 nitroreductase family deazaflavin-dependent oxidoreductase [Gammaproteobacteria bacterium]
MADSPEHSSATDKGTPPPRWFLKAYTKLNVFVYRISGGRLMNTLAGMPIILVGMIGARSGKRISIPLMYVPYEGGFVLVASQGGAPNNPAWYYNLIKNPEIEITHRGKTERCAARQVREEEKDKLWPICVEYYPPYEEYQERTSRNIPVFFCE